jgi:hypothetical protein
MRYEIKERIKTIITNDSGLTGIFRIEDEYPAMIQAPSILIFPRQDSGYQHSGGNRFTTEVQFDIRVYLADVGTRLNSINNIEVVTMPDLFATAFLSRLQLQYNDAGLTSGIEGVAGNLTFQIVSDLARPIEYPIGVQGAPRFWGFIVRLVIPYRTVIQSKVRGT